MFVVVFAFTYVLCVSVGYSQLLYEGERCKINGKTPGTCTKINSCSGAVQDIIAGKLPTICSYEKTTPIVCCPDTASAELSQPAKPTPAPVRPERPTNTQSSGQSRSKAWRMCQKYGEAVYRLEKIPTLALGEDDEDSRVDNITDCGIPPARDLIIGGEEASPKEFPHMSIIGYGTPNDIEWRCGGSLISERFVLTAAHCLGTRDKGPARWVRIGDLNMERNDDATKPQQFSVVDRIRHPDYKANAHYNDIALLKLDRDAQFTGYVRPACLNTEHRLGSTKPIATGWGFVNWADSTGSNELRKVQLNVYPGSLCNDSMGGDPKLKQGVQDSSMICAGELKGGKDTCGGDSGGPLQVTLKEPYCMYNIVGITSFGTIQCGARNTPAIYTRISNYIPWIEKHVWP